MKEERLFVQKYNGDSSHFENGVLNEADNEFLSEILADRKMIEKNKKSC